MENSARSLWLVVPLAVASCGGSPSTDVDLSLAMLDGSSTSDQGFAFDLAGGDLGCGGALPSRLALGPCRDAICEFDLEGGE